MSFPSRRQQAFHGVFRFFQQAVQELGGSRVIQGLFPIQALIQVPGRFR